MSKTLANKLFVGQFFTPMSKYRNHKIVNFVNIDEANKKATIEVKQYSILQNTDVMAISNKTITLPYAELANAKVGLK